MPQEPSLLPVEKCAIENVPVKWYNKRNQKPSPLEKKRLDG